MESKRESDGSCAPIACVGRQHQELDFYEFRVLTKTGNISKLAQEAHITDNLAIRAARQLAAGEPFEVWRGITCIHPVPTTRP